MRFKRRTAWKNQKCNECGKTTKKVVDVKPKSSSTNWRICPSCCKKIFIKFLKETAEIIIKRELDFQCLMCGNDLKKEIMDRKIHLHFCTQCRIVLMDRQLPEVARTIDEREKVAS